MLRNYIQGMFRGYLKHSDNMEFLLIFWAEAVQNHEVVWRDLMMEAYDRVGRWLDEIIGRGMESGVFRRVDTKSITSIIIAAMDGLAFQWVIYRGDFDVVAAGKKLADMAIYLLQSDRKQVLFPFVW
jgi:hypothetical protein